MTKIQITPMWKDVKPDGHYVYVHYRSDNGSIMYVGKGCKGRWISRTGRGRYWINSARLHGVCSEIVQDGLTEEQSFLLEMWLIAKFRHEGHNLVNRTDGGEGASGFKQSEETIRKRFKGRSGEGHHFYGKKLSEAHIKKLSDSHMGISKGLKNPRADRNKYHFRNIDGSYLFTTKSDFRELSGVSSSRVSDICNGKRNHSKGWYCSEMVLDVDFVMKRGIHSPFSIKEKVTIIHSNGEEITDFPCEILRSNSELCQGHFNSMLRGERKTHKGWSVKVEERD